MTQGEREELIVSLASTPERVRRLTEGFNMEKERWNPPGGEFSMVENVCHLRDIEVDGYAVRIKRILLEDQPLLTDIDGAKLAKERDYNTQDLSSAIEAFAKAREENVRTIRALTPEQLAKTASLENTGLVTLERLIEMMCKHDEAHEVELTALRSKIVH